MKKKYNNPLAEVVKLNAADIMRTSLTLSFNLNGSDDVSDFSNLFK